MPDAARKGRGLLEEARGGAATAIALVLHALLVASGALVPDGKPTTARSSGASRAALEIEIEHDVGPAPAAVGEERTNPIEEEAAPVRAPVVAARPVRRAAVEARAPAAPEPAAEVSPPAEAPRGGSKETTDTPPAPSAEAGDPGSTTPPGGPPAAPPGGDEWGSQPPEVALPGLGGDPVWKVPGAIGPLRSESRRPAPITAGPPPAVDPDIAGRVLRGTLERRDADLGVGVPAAGLVATTVADIVRSSEAPEGRATFEVKLGPASDVQSVRLVSSSSGSAATWRRVTGEISAALGRKTLRMGSAHLGATVVVKVETSYVYPAGTKERIEAEPVCAEEVLEEAARAAEALASGKDPIADPPPIGARDRKICIPVGVRGLVDASNLGAHKTKVVKTQLQVKTSNAPRLPAQVKVVDTRVPWLQNDPSKARLPRKKWDRKTKKFKREKVLD